MDNFWGIKSLLLTSNELFLIEKMKATEDVKTKRVQELYLLLIQYGLHEKIYWEILEDIEVLEEEIERSKKVRLTMSRHIS